MSTEPITTGSVSYTHLDVYKRQNERNNNSCATSTERMSQ